MISSRSIQSMAQEMSKIAVVVAPRDVNLAAVPVQESIYAPEVYGHEAGHYGYQKRLGGWHKALGVGSAIGGVGGVLSTIGGLGVLGHSLQNSATLSDLERGVRTGGTLMAVGQGLGVLSDVPRLAEETAASLRSLKALEGKLTPEELAVAKKRLFRAGATYYAPTLAEAGALGLTLAGLATKNPMATALGGIGGTVISRLGPAGSLLAARKMSQVEGGKMMTGDEIKALHQEMAPDIALSMSNKPSEAGAFYMHAMSPKAKFRRALATEEMKSLGLDKADVKDFLDRGGIFMAKTWNPADFHEMELKSMGYNKRSIKKDMKKFNEQEEQRKMKLRLEEKARALRAAQSGQAA
jgi:hypothetical protein